MTDYFMSEYICSLSGREAEADESPPISDDDLMDLPNGWIKITIQKREINPYFQQIQAVKHATKGQLIHSSLSQAEEEEAEITEEQKGLLSATISIQVDAQFSALEASVPVYSVDEEVLYVAPVVGDEELQSEWNKVRKILGMETEMSEALEVAE